MNAISGNQRDIQSSIHFGNVVHVCMCLYYVMTIWSFAILPRILFTSQNFTLEFCSVSRDLFAVWLQSTTFSVYWRSADNTSQFFGRNKKDELADWQNVYCTRCRKQYKHVRRCLRSAGKILKEITNSPLKLLFCEIHTHTLNEITSKNDNNVYIYRILIMYPTRGFKQQARQLSSH